MSDTSDLLKITPLGGIGEIGKNLTVFETANDMIILDCGCSFPTDATPGIERIYPDITYIKKYENKIRAIVITHGHEDHIGAIPYLLSNLSQKIPVYCTSFTWELLIEKNKEFDFTKVKHHIISPNTKKKLSDDFTAEFIHVNHSIPGCVAIALDTPVGYIVHTGDFKIDLCPVDNDVFDFIKFGQLGKKGVTLLMTDSTNAEREGYSVSENVVSRTLTGIFKGNKDRRIIVSTFASNIYRINKVIELSESQNRKVVILGRSIENTVLAAIKSNICKAHVETLITMNDAIHYKPEQLTIISTGAQGEVNAQLTRIVDGTHPKLKIEKGDAVILSSRAIPGNEKAVDTVINKLYEIGAIVFSDRNADVHASGHANQEEIKTVLALTKPHFYMPVHGEPLHLKAARNLGIQMGIEKQNIIITKNGRPVILTRTKWGRGNPVECGEIYIDGEFEREVNPAVIRDRQILMNDGIVIVTTGVNMAGRYITSPVSINSRGLIYINESRKIMQEISQKATMDLEILLADPDNNISDIKVSLSKMLGKQIYLLTGKNPMVIAMINE